MMADYGETALIHAVVKMRLMNCMNVITAWFILSHMN